MTDCKKVEVKHSEIIFKIKNYIILPICSSLFILPFIQKAASTAHVTWLAPWAASATHVACASARVRTRVRAGRTCRAVRAISARKTRSACRRRIQEGARCVTVLDARISANRRHISGSRYVKIRWQGDQRQGKSGRIREFRSPVFKSGKIRENGPFWRKSGKNQGISLWIREKIREFRYSIYFFIL